MSTHPNVILMLHLQPDDLVNKTFREIREAVGGKLDTSDSTFDFKIGEAGYGARVMEDDYYQSMQLAGQAGEILIWDLVTYGYGDCISWTKLEAQKNALENWASDICVRFKCRYAIDVSANYW